jgi:hypothetical protein
MKLVQDRTSGLISVKLGTLGMELLVGVRKNVELSGFVDSRELLGLPLRCGNASWPLAWRRPVVLFELARADDIVIRVICGDERRWLQLWRELHLEDMPFLGLLGDNVEFLSIKKHEWQRRECQIPSTMFLRKLRRGCFNGTRSAHYRLKQSALASADEKIVSALMNIGGQSVSSDPCAGIRRHTRRQTQLSRSAIIFLICQLNSRQHVIGELSDLVSHLFQIGLFVIGLI